MTHDTINNRRHRSLLMTSAIIVVVVALVVAIGVIPPVRVTTLPLITPDRAVPAFWKSAGLQLFAGLALLFIAMQSKSRSRVTTEFLVVTGIVVLLLGLLFNDAAFAFHSTGMPTVSALLFSCVAADTLAGVLAIITACV